MAEKNGEKRSYTQNLTEINMKLGKLETIAGYQENHMKNIDSHLEVQNNRIGKTEVQTAKNTTSLTWIRWGCGIILTGGGLTTLSLYIAGVI